VRHGETVLNVAKKRQGPDGGLSEQGIQQVVEISQRLKNIKFNKVFCSPFQRTKETFEIINKEIHLSTKKVCFTKLLTERKNPTNIIGKDYDDEVVKQFINVMDKSYHDPDLRIYDEENFSDLKKRALECQKYLKKFGGKKNLCITHGIFLKIFLATIIYGKNLLQSEYIKVSEYNDEVDNASITLISYDSLKNILNKIFFRTSLKNNPWEILSYNESTIQRK